MKTVAIFLLMAMLIPMLAACRTQKDPPNTTTVTTTSTHPGDDTPGSNDCEKHTPSAGGMYCTVC